MVKKAIQKCLQERKCCEQCEVAYVQCANLTVFVTIFVKVKVDRRSFKKTDRKRKYYTSRKADFDSLASTENEFRPAKIDINRFFRPATNISMLETPTGRRTNRWNFSTNRIPVVTKCATGMERVGAIKLHGFIVLQNLSGISDQILSSALRLTCSFTPVSSQWWINSHNSWIISISIRWRCGLKNTEDA